jgi:hypothetical protein
LASLVVAQGLTVVLDGQVELDQPDVVLESIRVEIWMVDVDAGGQSLAIGIGPFEGVGAQDDLEGHTPTPGLEEVAKTSRPLTLLCSEPLSTPTAG